MVAVTKQDHGKHGAGEWCVVSLQQNAFPSCSWVGGGRQARGRCPGDSGFLFRFPVWFSKSHCQPVGSHFIHSSDGRRGNSSQGLIERQVWSAQILSKCITQILSPPLYPLHHLRHTDSYTPQFNPHKNVYSSQSGSALLMNVTAFNPLPTKTVPSKTF